MYGKNSFIFCQFVYIMNERLYSFHFISVNLCICHFPVLIIKDKPFTLTMQRAYSTFFFFVDSIKSF